MMLIISGHLVVEPDGRDAYLQACVPAVEQARRAPGCLDFSLAADLLDDSRINVYERWSSEEELLAFRQSGPSEEQQGEIKDASVQRYEIASEGTA